MLETGSRPLLVGPTADDRSFEALRDDGGGLGIGRPRTVTVSAFAVPGALPSQVLLVARGGLAEVRAHLPPGYRLETAGEQEGFRELALVMAASMALIYFALVFQFDSALKPVVVFAAIPYGMAGAMAVLAALHQPFGFEAFLGVASLVGVIVSHVIVLFDFIEEARVRGAALEDALLDVGIVRLRPVLIMVGGHRPRPRPARPARRSPVGTLVLRADRGLSVATAVTLVLVPVLYPISVLGDDAGGPPAHPRALRLPPGPEGRTGGPGPAMVGGTPPLFQGGDPLRLATFVPAPGDLPRLGLLLPDGRLLDLAGEARHLREPLPFDTGDMVSLIASGEAGLAALRALASRPAGGLAPGSVRLLAPIHRPRRNVFCVGWNYLEHFAEGEAIRQTKQQLPEHPVFFSKATNAVNGPFDPIPFDAAVSEQIDWEVELGVVVGTRGKDIPEASAMAHVFGYTVLNDVSARDVQRAHGGQWLKGKSLDGFCPMGPYLVTADEVDPGDLRVITRVNGTVKQDSSTRHLYFKIPRLLCELSRGLTLEPGDVLSTGTPAGVGFARTPPEFLKPGDVLETEIVGLGLMRNPIGA